jgi:hypothetical protein
MAEVEHATPDIQLSCEKRWSRFYSLLRDEVVGSEEHPRGVARSHARVCVVPTDYDPHDATTSVYGFGKLPLLVWPVAAGRNVARTT